MVPWGREVFCMAVRRVACGGTVVTIQDVVRATAGGMFRGVRRLGGPLRPLKGHAAFRKELGRGDGGRYLLLVCDGVGDGDFRRGTGSTPLGPRFLRRLTTTGTRSHWTRPTFRGRLSQRSYVPVEVRLGGSTYGVHGRLRAPSAVAANARSRPRQSPAIS